MLYCAKVKLHTIFINFFLGRTILTVSCVVWGLHAGEEIVLKKNFFVEKLLPLSIMRPLTEEEMSTYVAPFKKEGRDRLPTLTWPREIPIKTDGQD